MNQVRLIAICVIRSKSKILVYKNYDKIRKKDFFRPVSANIEFGMQSVEALASELKENFVIKVHDLEYLGALENIYTYLGQNGHEVIFVYEGKIKESALDDSDGIDYTDGNKIVKLRWKELSDFHAGKDKLYPEGLAELLMQHYKV